MQIYFIHYRVLNIFTSFAFFLNAGAFSNCLFWLCSTSKISRIAWNFSKMISVDWNQHLSYQNSIFITEESKKVIFLRSVEQHHTKSTKCKQSSSTCNRSAKILSKILKVNIIQPKINFANAQMIAVLIGLDAWRNQKSLLWTEFEIAVLLHLFSNNLIYDFITKYD